MGAGNPRRARRTCWFSEHARREGGGGGGDEDEAKGKGRERGVDEGVCFFACAPGSWTRRPPCCPVV
jgi:hypothetical protein